MNINSIIINWFNEYIIPLTFAIVTIIVAYIIYLFLKKQVLRLKKKERIDTSNAKNIINLLKISISIFIIVIISIHFSETFGLLTGIFTVAGGTIIGFAAMNTLGNLIAGLIIMVSKPFKVGDRIMFNKRLADVVEIKLVYTILKDLDGVSISVPNLNLLKGEIENFGQDKILRRNIKISAGYDVDPRLVEKALLNAATKFKNILKYPEPRVDLYDYLDYAIQYRLIVYINNSKLIPKFDFDLRKAVYYSCQDYKIDLATPSLIKSVNQEKSRDIVNKIDDSFR